MDPVSWSYSYEQNEDGKQSVILTAEMEDGWVIYAQNTPEGGPKATIFSFDKQEGVEWIGDVIPQSEMIKKFSPLFEIEVFKYQDNAQFIQSLKANDSVKSISGSVYFMTCNGQQCLAPKEIVFEVPLNN